MTTIQVVNLERADERRKLISQQLDKINLDYTIFNAVDGKASPNHPLFRKYNRSRSLSRRGKELNLGQLGCYASHYLLWELCVNSNENFIIIEDDAIIDGQKLLEFLKHCDNLPEEIECIRLFDNKKRSFSSKQYISLDTLEVHKFNKGHMSTTAYFITPNGAKKLLEHSKSWYLPVDIMMDRFWENKLECFGLVPSCVSNDEKLDSYIADNTINKTKRPFLVRVRREIYHLIEDSQRFIHNLKFWLTK
ncbi:glycosyltransferase family 25 protein [bacterium 19MO02SH05]|uniref:Glycosyltransferase family 25 protein n=1 Tax=bacterium 19MO02SH05 TaxID=2920696 RepID=A0AAU6THI8_UNCXX|nr:glycosyltransferase family 25 protein [Vibrio metschnikovii]